MVVAFPHNSFGGRYEGLTSMTTYDADKAVAENEPHGAETPAGGEGPTTEKQPSQRAYHHPAAGWGAAKSVTHVLLREHALIDGPRAIFKMNHESGGFDCPGCAWPDDTKGLKLDICENGIKHVTWEMTPKRAGRELFAAHSVSELATWT